MGKIKGFVLKHVILAGLIGSLIWNGVAFGLTFVYWGVNPIFPPPFVMVFPAALISLFSGLSWNPYTDWEFYVFLSLPLSWLIFSGVALLYRTHTRLISTGK